MKRWLILFWSWGHPQTGTILKKFIKADQLEVVEKTIDKYDYFD